MFSSSNNSTVNYVLSALKDELLHFELSKLDILHNGSCEKQLISLNPKILATPTDCTNALAYNNEKNFNYH